MAPDNLRPDPAGVLPSDVHRRVLGHLSTPDADVGWTPVALLLRLAPDKNTPLPPADDNGFADTQEGLIHLDAILADLESDGLAKSYSAGQWRMTQKGFDLLTGPIANEPPPGAEPEGPAEVIGDPTPIGGK